MSIITCLGNVMVLWGRCSQRNENQSLNIVINNLAVSDFLMGIYLCLICIQDQRFRDEYHVKSMEWITSWSCVFVGMLAVVSSEVSLLILSFISIERFLLLTHPFGLRQRLNEENVRSWLFIIWFCGVTIAFLPGMCYNESNIL